MAGITVVGGGVIGLACAFHLRRDGHDVTLIDRDPDGDSTSWGNAGAIAVTECVPASAPGLLWRVPGWLVDPLGPLAIRPAYAPRLLPWMIAFLRAAAPRRFAEIAAALAALNAQAYGDLLPVLAALGQSGDLHRVGALTVYESDTGFARDQSEWDLRRRYGIECQPISGDEARAMEPALGPLVRHAVWTPDWSHVDDPRRIVFGLLGWARAQGVRVVAGQVTGVEMAATGGRVRLADGGTQAFDRLVVAAGAWSHRLVAGIGDKVRLESERGYNTTLPAPGLSLSRQITFGERKFVATPLAIGLRIGGAAEFAGLEAPANYARSAALLQSARRYLPGLQEAGGTQWMGNRPATPDTLPVIGRSPRHKDAFYAFGHGHLGLTQAASTGRLIADLIADRPPPLDMAPFGIGRFG